MCKRLQNCFEIADLESPVRIRGYSSIADEPTQLKTVSAFVSLTSSNGTNYMIIIYQVSIAKAVSNVELGASDQDADRSSLLPHRLQQFL